MDKILKPIHDATVNHMTISESWGKSWVPRIFKQAGLEQHSNKNWNKHLKWPIKVFVTEICNQHELRWCDLTLQNHCLLLFCYLTCLRIHKPLQISTNFFILYLWAQLKHEIVCAYLFWTYNVMQVTADLSVEIKKRQQNEPYILCCGDVCHSEQLYLLIEEK